MAERNVSLFPPIVDSYMPSFAIEKGLCQISFQISDYNSMSEIMGAEVSVRFQSTNASALIENKEFIFKKNDDNFKKNLIILSKDEVSFIADTIYKVQIRLIGKPVDKEYDYEKGDYSYSEWSTVCLIKGINEPKLRVPLFDDSIDIGDMVVNTGTIEVQATVENLDKEEIYYYEMIISENGNEYENSGKIYTTDASDKNLKYAFKKQLEVNKNYTLKISFCTTSYYTFEKEYSFVHSIIDEQINIEEIILEENNEQGYIEAAVPTKNLLPGSYIILRASSLDNFSTWKDIHLFQKGIDNQELVEWIKKEHSESAMDGSPWQNFQDSYIKNENKTETEKQELYIYRDYTVQGGVLYKYKIQNYGKGGIRSLESKASEAALCYFDDIFLGDKNFQLKIKYDSNISSPKRNIMETKTDTLGGQYPIIRRNGNAKYESFSISGIISIFGDENEFYDESWKLEKEWQNNYYNKYNISNMRDFIGEKAYRDKVSDFLQDGQVKLFRSTQEGNFLVRLMDISFTPNQQLGRLIYSFSATAYQIADLTVENYFKYNIINNIVYSDSQDIISKEYIFGQLEELKTDNEQPVSIFDLIKPIYEKPYLFNNYNITTSLNKITKIRIQPSSVGNFKIYHVKPNGDLVEVKYQFNNAPLFLSGETKISGAISGIIDYEAELKIQYQQDAYKTQYISYNIGQKKVNINEDIILSLKDLYNQKISDLYYQEIEKINAIYFHNNGNAECRINIIYGDNHASAFIINAGEDYLLISDILERKDIISIKTDKPIDIDYYYTLSKKYYFKED